MKGWVKIWREQFNNPVSKKPWCDGYAWSYLYSRANYKKGMVNFRNEYIEIERGQFLTSKIKLENIFGWTRRHTENFLKALENDEMITYRVTNRFIVITVIKYEQYQSNDEQGDIQDNKQVTNRRQTEDKQITTNKKDKKDKKVKKEDTLSSRCALIINYLNKKTGKKYIPKSHMDLIRARINEGRTVKDFIDVIDKKVEDWSTNEKMVRYIRPSTLFSKTNFENYMNEPEKDKFSKYLKKE